MSNRTCSVCERKHYAHGLCKAHYRRVHEGRGLNPDKPLRELPNAADRDDVVGRILAKCVTTASGCIEYCDWLNPDGYGSISWRGKRWQNHRAMWTVQVGPIPTDDDWTNKIRYIDECRNGHPRTPENTSTRGGKRNCLQCSRDSYARRSTRINAALRERYAEKRAAGVDWREARKA